MSYILQIDEQFGPNGDITTLYRDFSHGVDLFMSKLPGKAKFKQVDLVSLIFLIFDLLILYRIT